MKKYIKPTTEIVELKLASHLLVISGDDQNVRSVSFDDYDAENVTIM